MARTYLQSDLADLRTDDCKWSEVADYILDADGPLVRPYRRMGSDFASVPIVDHLRDIAEQYPDKLAVGDGVDRLNYSDLFSAVENLSRRIANSVADGEAVGIFSPARSGTRWRCWRAWPRGGLRFRSILEIQVPELWRLRSPRGSQRSSAPARPATPACRKRSNGSMWPPASRRRIRGRPRHHFPMSSRSMPPPSCSIPRAAPDAPKASSTASAACCSGSNNMSTPAISMRKTSSCP